MMIDKALIHTNKNLLAFSAGVDSSALFFILLENNISFDIAIVDYNLRDESKDEIQYAINLAKKYNKKIYTSSFAQDKFSEKAARDFRYNFFDKIIEENLYEALITGHQLNDKLEWFLMQFSKGAGLYELLGLEKCSRRKNYLLFRPLLDISKEKLLDYLKINNYKYYVDKSNSENIYKRNKIRNDFSNDFLNEYENGIKKSFEYLQNDIKSLNVDYYELKYYDLLIKKYNTLDDNLIIRDIDRELKKFGTLISGATRDEIIRQKSIIISNKISIDIIDNLIYMAPISNLKMTKEFKEICRLNKIPKNIRAYLFEIQDDKFKNFLLKMSLFKTRVI